MNIDQLKQFATEQDAQDTLAHFRNDFYLPSNAEGQTLTYLCGNSLGLQPRSTPDYLQQELVDWQNLGVEGHFHAQRPWMPYHEQLTEKMAKVVGAMTSEVVCMNSLTANLHLMLVSFYRPSGKRCKIVIEKGAFPSDQYAVDSQIRFHGFDPAQALIELEPMSGKEYLDTQSVIETLDKHSDEIALVMLPGVQYYTGQVLNIAEITRSAKEYHITIGWDLAHSVGNVPLQLHDSGADFAVWCNYKYMNAGPGAIGGCFVHLRHHNDSSLKRFAGWWGQNKATRFAMGPVFDPITSVEGWQLSNPPILAMAPLLASLDLFDRAGMSSLIVKSHAITRALIEYIQQHFAAQIQIMTPLDDHARGAQLSLKVERNGKALQQSLIDNGVICDWREPDCIRIAFAPLYNSYSDLYDFVLVLHRMFDHK